MERGSRKIQLSLQMDLYKILVDNLEWNADHKPDISKLKLNQFSYHTNNVWSEEFTVLNHL